MSIEDGKIITNNICTNLFRKTGRVFSKFSCSRDTPRNNYSGFLIAWVQFKISLPSRRFHKTFLSRPVGFVILLMRTVTIGLKRKFREGEKLAFICLHCGSLAMRSCKIAHRNGEAEFRNENSLQFGEKSYPSRPLANLYSQKVVYSKFFKAIFAYSALAGIKL